jgi:hypothetical protein
MVTLERATKAQRGSRCVALLFIFGDGWRWVVSATPRPLYPRERPGNHYIGGWMVPRADLDGCGNSSPPTGVRSPDRLARSESLYRLSYPVPPVCRCTSTKCAAPEGYAFTSGTVSTLLSLVSFSNRLLVAF